MYLHVNTQFNVDEANKFNEKEKDVVEGAATTTTTATAIEKVKEEEEKKKLY